MIKPISKKPRPKIEGVDVLLTIKTRARIVSDHFRRSPGGDEYTYTGNTNMIDDLRDALDHYDEQYEHIDELDDE